MDSGLSLSPSGMITEAGYSGSPGGDSATDYQAGGYSDPDAWEPPDTSPYMPGDPAGDLPFDPGPAYVGETDPGPAVLTGDQTLGHLDMGMATQPGNEPIDVPVNVPQEDTGAGAVACAATPAELLAVEAQHAEEIAKARGKLYGAAALAFVGGWMVARWMGGKGS